MANARLQSVSSVGAVPLAFNFRFGRAFAANLGLAAVAYPASFVTTLLLSRTLGPAEFGLYAYVLAWATVLVLPAIFGFDAVLIRDLAAACTARDWSLMRGLFGGAVRIVGLASLAICLASAGAIGLWSYGRGETRLTLPLLIGLMLVPLVALRQIIQATLQGLQRPLLAALTNSFAQPLTMLLVTAAAVAVLRERLTPYHAIGLQIAACFAALLVGGGLLGRTLPREFHAATRRTDYRRWLWAAAPFVVSQLIIIGNERLPLLILGLAVELQEVGVFALASSLALLLAVPLATANSLIAGRVSHLHARGDKAELQRLLATSVRFCLLITAPAAIVEIVWGDKLLGLFREDFASGFLTLRILAVGQLFNVATGSVGVTLTMSGHARDAVRCAALATGLSLLLCGLLISRFGAPGAAVAQCAGVIAYNALLTLKVRQRLGINPTILAVWRGGVTT